MVIFEWILSLGNNARGIYLLTRFIQSLCLVIVLVILTIINHNFYPVFGITGITMFYLLVVVTAAYFCTFYIASYTAIASFLVINYFFISPRYTFEVAHIESWVSLISFLIVSLVITSLVKRLKSQTAQSNVAYQRAEFARTLAEKLVQIESVEELVIKTCDLLRIEFMKSFVIAQSDENKHYTFSSEAPLMPLDQSALHWVADNSKPIGPYTDNWSNSEYWLIPFSRFPSLLPILVVYPINENDEPGTLTLIKTYVDQISTAYQRLINNQRAKQAELIAQEESIRNALLTSISHDMRTPLTSILGAATTLQNSHNLISEEAKQFTSLIESEARYLAGTTENILSLIRLESTAAKDIPMDWQTPEEILGIVGNLYKIRDKKINLKITINDSEMLIKGNANLLSQALVNLIDNAIKASLTDSPIEIVVNKSNSYINICVNDRGNGINPIIDIVQIKKFSTTKEKGFGLGLSIVSAIAKYHDALFKISNHNGGGVSAMLSFPVLEINNVEA